MTSSTLGLWSHETSFVLTTQCGIGLCRHLWGLIVTTRRSLGGGEIPQNNFVARIGVFKPNAKNYNSKSTVSMPIKYSKRWRPRSTAPGNSKAKHACKKSKMANGRRIWKKRKSHYLRTNDNYLTDFDETRQIEPLNPKKNSIAAVLKIEKNPQYLGTMSLKVWVFKNERKHGCMRQIANKMTHGLVNSETNDFQWLSRSFLQSCRCSLFYIQ